MKVKYQELFEDAIEKRRRYEKARTELFELERRRDEVQELSKEAYNDFQEAMNNLEGVVIHEAEAQLG